MSRPGDTASAVGRFDHLSRADLTLELLFHYKQRLDPREVLAEFLRRAWNDAEEQASTCSRFTHSGVLSDVARNLR